MPQWNVYKLDRVGGRDLETFVETVEADTASHACDWINKTKWIARLRLTARPVEEGQKTEQK